MTGSFVHAPEQSSRFNAFVVGLLTTAILGLSAVLLLSPFMA